MPSSRALKEATDFDTESSVGKLPSQISSGITKHNYDPLSNGPGKTATVSGRDSGMTQPTGRIDGTSVRPFGPQPYPSAAETSQGQSR